MTPKLLLFDLDETVAPDEEVDRALFDEIATHLDERHGAGRDLPAAMAEASAALWGRGAAAAYCARIGISAWEGLWGPFGPSEDPMLAALHAFVPGYRSRAWADALAACGLDDAALAESLAVYFAVERHARQAAYPWARAVLEPLGARHRLGMITNGAPDLQRLKLAATGLAGLFSPLVVSGDLGEGKPEPAIFARALERAGVAPEEAVMVGDSWQRDIAGAAAAGLRAVWIAPHGARPPAVPPGTPPVAVAADLRALPAALAALERPA